MHYSGEFTIDAIKEWLSDYIHPVISSIEEPHSLDRLFDGSTPGVFLFLEKLDETTPVFKAF